MSLYTLAYDADCGPCTRFRKAVGWLDAHRNLRFVSLHQADEEGILASVPPGRRHSSFHLVMPDKSVKSGAGALPELISLLPAGKFVARLIVGAPGGTRAVSFAYSVTSRLHDSGSCSYKPSFDSFKESGREETSRRQALPLPAGLLA